MNLTIFQEELLKRYKEENGGEIDLTDAFFLTSSTTEAHAIGKEEGKQEGFVLGLKRALEIAKEAKDPFMVPATLARFETALTAELTSLEKVV